MIQTNDPDQWPEPKRKSLDERIAIAFVVGFMLGLLAADLIQASLK